MEARLDQPAIGKEQTMKDARSGGETANRDASVAANIEKFLSNHSEEGHAWQSNMVARPVKWQEIPASEGAAAVGAGSGSE